MGNGSIFALFQNRTTHARTQIPIKPTILPLERSTSSCLIQRSSVIARRTARIANASHVFQIFGNASKIVSPPARRLPAPGLRGIEASAQLRHEDPAIDASHLSFVRSVEESATNKSHSAGGASSLKTRASILFWPLRKNRDTSKIDIRFQLRFAPVSTGSPFILSSSRLAARSSRRAAFGCESSVSVRRNVASVIATRWDRASTADGNTIHSARPS